MDDYEKTYKYCLYNLSTPYNFQNKCDIENLWSLFTLDDFSHNYSNPYFMTYTFWPNYTTQANTNNSEYTINLFNKLFFIVCYAYSLFRLVIDIAVIVYAKKKVTLLLSDKETQDRIIKYPHLSTEINVYKWIIYLGVCFEFLMSLHNVIVWRGLQYFTSYQDNFFDLSLKPPRKCNCIYNSRLYLLTAQDTNQFPYYRSRYFTTMYVLWIIMEFSGNTIVYFSVLTLSRINRKGKLGKELVAGTMKKSLFLGVFYGLLLFVLIFVFDMPVFFKFFSIDVLVFWFFWKSLGFFLLLDRLHSKYWLFQNLKIQFLYTEKTRWTKKVNEIKENILLEDSENLIGNLQQTIDKNNELTHEENGNFKRIVDENQEKIKKIFKESMDYFYEKIKGNIIENNEKEKKSKLKTNWAEYLNYLLRLNLLGLFGYFFLILDASYLETIENYSTPRFLYFLGIIFCYLELVIFDLTHGIYLLHCFFIELFKYLKRLPETTTRKVFLSDESSDCKIK